MFTGKNSENEIKEIMEDIDNTEIDFAKKIEARFRNILKNAEAKISELNEIEKRAGAQAPALFSLSKD